MINKDYLKCESKLKYILFLIIYIIVYIPSFVLYHRKNLWLICERGKDAQDNGYIFYKYLKDNKKEIKLFYLIDKNSPDINKIDKENMVTFGCIKHFMLSIGCKVQISSHLFGYCPWPTFMLYLRKHKAKNIHVFLQHGITYNNQYGFYKSVCKALSLYICGSSYEQQYVCNTFGYSKEEAVLTGFARFDNLHVGITEKSLVIMPTWRRYLANVDNQAFINSSYYEHWNSLLNNSVLIEMCRQNNLKLIFYLHSSLQPFADNFGNLKNVTVIKYGEMDVQSLLKESNLLVTDYSSVFFDCLYMNKKVLLYQFDIDDFKKDHYNEGYFNQLNKEYIPVKTTENDIINIIKVMLTDKNKQKYYLLSNYSNTFFGLKDQNNCKRIFEAILSKL